MHLSYHQFSKQSLTLAILQHRWYLRSNKAWSTLNWALGAAIVSSSLGAQKLEMSVQVYCSSSLWLSSFRKGNASRVSPPVPAPAPASMTQSPTDAAHRLQPCHPALVTELGSTCSIQGRAMIQEDCTLARLA